MDCMTDDRIPELPRDWYPLHRIQCPMCNTWIHDKYNHCGSEKCREEYAEARRENTG